MMSKSSRTAPKFRVAICGAGPGGLALAATLARYNDPIAPVAIDIYESQPTLGTIGAGISVWPRTRHLLGRLGLIDGLKDEIGATERPEGGKGFHFRKSDPPEVGYNFYDMPMPTDPLLIHRSALVTVLRGGFDSHPFCTIHTSARLLSYSYSVDSDTESPLTLKFSDGSTAAADVLIGADGIHSVVRATMFWGLSHGDDLPRQQPKWTGTVAYRSLIERKTLDGIWKDHRALTLPMMYCGKDKHVVTYPISQGTLVNFVGFYTIPGAEGTTFTGKWVQDVPVEEVMACYAGFEPEVQALLKCFDKASAWAIHILDSVPKSSDGPVAIIGDAAHAMETHFGAGAGQAMEDAYIIGRLLTHPLTSRKHIHTALSIYDSARLKFAQGVVISARMVGQMYEFGKGWAPPVRSTEQQEDEIRNASPQTPEAIDWAQRWGKEVSGRWCWQWEANIDADWDRAESQLKVSVQATAVMGRCEDTS